ncbi:gluconokinase [Pseudomonas sp. RIT-PI-AD]|uniref:gluconokinase n=1 Tax=Pseudomonas sp. RIT-PI-AD TaxID=3035294 RepID=UPI0021D8AC59|nr:gluconokinase [Pseudomonas sp. RIT-PI-AD]
MTSPEPQRCVQTILVMGVSGSGKTTIGSRLARRLGCGFSDADEFHSAANKAKMAHGIPLTDEDRQPWLRDMRAAIEARQREGGRHVFACSALKRAYRDLLRREDENLLMVFLDGPEHLLAERLGGRSGHFFDPALLNSQLQALERPGPAEAWTLDIRLSVEELVEDLARRIERLPQP